MQCAFYEWHERSGNVQKDPRPKENSRRWTYKLMLWKPVSWKDQISAGHGEQTVLLWIFQEKGHAACLWRNMLRYRRDTAERRSKERTGFSSGQARMETFSFREESLSRCYNAAINLKTIRYYIITQGKGLPRRRYFHMMLTNTMY